MFKFYLESKIIERAEAVAKHKHEGQYRKGPNKEPYFVHPKRVAEIIKKYQPKNKHLIAAALLHDTVEDTDLTLKEIKAMFGVLIADLVEELTSDEEKIKTQGKANYLKEKMSNMTKEALLIKLADRLDNVSDLTEMPKDFQIKYTKETKEILNELEKFGLLSGVHGQIIRAIKRKLGMFLKEK